MAEGILPEDVTKKAAYPAADQISKLEKPVPANAGPKNTPKVPGVTPALTEAMQSGVTSYSPDGENPGHYLPPESVQLGDGSASLTKSRNWLTALLGLGRQEEATQAAVPEPVVVTPSAQPAQESGSSGQ